MKAKNVLSVLALAAALLLTGALPGNEALAARPPGAGGGGGGGGGGDGETTEPTDFGDLWVLYRDQDGVPILSASVQVPDPESGQLVDGGLCLQPLAAPGVTWEGCVVPPESESCLIPVDAYSCGVLLGYEAYVQEVDFSRMDVVRSPPSVLDSQLADLLVSVSTATCLTLDPAGRLVFLNPDTADADGDGDVEELLAKTVDSPIQNLAIYREMMTRGALGEPPLGLPAPPGINRYGFLDTAAKGLGAASDKTGHISLDQVVYLNQLLGLDTPGVALHVPTRCIWHRAEVQGSMRLVQQCFLLYHVANEVGEEVPYGYLRGETYGQLPHPANVPADEPQPGYFQYLDVYPDETGPGGETLFWINESAILPAVFPDGTGTYLPGYEGGNIGGFAQAGDDARAVIEFMHSHPVMADYAAPVLCDGSPPPSGGYDVALSTLQMPIRMVTGSLREGTVTVVNNGPALASGTVTVTGEGSAAEWSWSYTDSFALVAGESRSWTLLITAPSVPMEIQWQAVVEAPADVLNSNNTLSATTIVSRPKGNGGSGEHE